MAELPVTLDDVKQAAARIAGVVVHTPCLRSETLSRIARADVWLKFENLQFTASFKERGALNTLLQLTPEERKRGVIAMSRRQPCAGRRLPRRPARHPRDHRDAVLHAQHQGHAHARPRRRRSCCTATRWPRPARKRIASPPSDKLVFVHPYDDPRIIAGQGTMALEMLQDVPQLDTLVVPVGGGGMIAGCAVAARGLKPDIKVIGVESAGYSRCASSSPASR